MMISVNGVSINSNQAGNARYDKDSNVLYAGNMSGTAGAAGAVDEKRAMAKKQIRALIKEAWDKDTSVSKGLEGLEKEKKAMFDRMQEYRKKTENIDAYVAKYIEENDIDTESTEYKDLMVLKKYQDYKNGVPVDDFSDEEVERLKELQNIPRTDFQNKMLAINADRDNASNDLYMAEQKLKVMMQQYSDSVINQPQSETMHKVSDAVDEIMDAVNSDAVSEFVREGITNAEERMEETKEEAKKLEEEREERQQRIDEAKERRKEQEEILDEAAKSDRIDYKLRSNTDNYDNYKDVQEKVRLIMKRANMDIEELKGIEIDFNY